MKKIIAIEAQRIFRQKKGGMDVVILEIIRELQKIDKENRYYILIAPGPDRCLEETDNFTLVEIPGTFYPFWEQVSLVKALKKIRPHLVHCTSNTAPLFWDGPLLLTLHDIIFLERNRGKNTSGYQVLGTFYRSLLVPLFLKKKSTLLTVSHSEKANIMRRFPIADENIDVVHNACSSAFFPREVPESERKLRGMPPKYFLMLGNTDPRKNVLGVLKAYVQYRILSKTPIPLVITGLNKEELSRYLSTINEAELQDKILLPGYVSFTDLPWWYCGAEATLYLSLREGFGIPILESMACGTPVLTSSVSSMPEVAGSEGMLMNPESPDEISKWLIRLDKDEKLRITQRAYGLERVKKFSWERSAQQILKKYNDLIIPHALCE